jgi:lysophospholipase
VLTAPLIGLPKSGLVRYARPILMAMRLCGRGGSYVPGARPNPPGREDFIGNVLTSDPVRFARSVAVLEAEPRLALGGPTVSWVSALLRATAKFEDPSYAGSIRQPILMVAAGHDQVVSTSAIETFADNLLAGSHLILPGARHEILQEQDQYRRQFWAAFDAFVPGTPLY